MLFGATAPGVKSFGDLAWKHPVRGAALPNDTSLPLCTLSPAGPTVVPGQTLTASANGSFNGLATFGGFAGFVVGDRVLVAQAGNANVPAGANGIYTITSLGAIGAPWVLTRATDDDTAREQIEGSAVFVAPAGVSVGIPHWAALLVQNDSAAWQLLPQEFDYFRYTGIIGPMRVDAPGGVGSTAISMTDGDIVFGAGGVSAAGGAVRRGTASIAGAPFDALVPTGAIVAFGGAAAPNGWLLCQGQSLLRTDYADLFAVIGTTYGAVDGTHFTLPDLRQRFPLGKAAAGTGSVLGGTGGAIDHTHTSTAHSHSHSHQDTYDSSGTATSWRARAFGAGSATTMTRFVNTTAASAAMNYELTDTDATSTTPGATGSNNPPFQVVNYIIHV